MITYKGIMTEELLPQSVMDKIYAFVCGYFAGVNGKDPSSFEILIVVQADPGGCYLKAEGMCKSRSSENVPGWTHILFDSDGDFYKFV